MFAYAFPLVIVGFAGMINELLDRVVLTHLLPFDLAMNNYYLGLYGANYKLAMFMALLIKPSDMRQTLIFYPNQATNQPTLS